MGSKWVSEVERRQASESVPHGVKIRPFRFANPRRPLKICYRCNPLTINDKNATIRKINLSKKLIFLVKCRA